MHFYILHMNQKKACREKVCAYCKGCVNEEPLVKQAKLPKYACFNQVHTCRVLRLPTFVSYLIKTV
jgi:hypothetical protein